MVKIFCKDKEVLHVKNIAFEIFYENILDIIERKNLFLNEKLNNLIDKLYVGAHGVGTDVAKFLKNPNDVTVFAELVKEAVIRHEKEYPNAIEAVDRFKVFHQELVKYGKELE